MSDIAGIRLRRHLSGYWEQDDDWGHLFHSGSTVPYSNDPFAAKVLPGVIAAATDLSSMSPELEAYSHTWPASYYLSPMRTSLLRGFAWPDDQPVLEVGAGCGTITRFLGETFTDVVAVEGHPDRARVAAGRTRDLSTVSVACSGIHKLSAHEVFGIVFCIGVLEYSPSFDDHPDAALRFAGHLRSLVRDDGWLVLAIENRLGVKYLRGEPEDHTDRRFEGVHGYPRPSTPRTWSRAELGAMLTTAGFETVHFSYPLPDYKFPEIVLSEAAAHSKYAAALSAFTASKRPSGATPSRLDSHTFDGESVTAQAAHAGLLGELANSFLVIASPKAGKPVETLQPWDALRHTFNRRRPELRSKWQIDSVDALEPTVKRSRLLPDSKATFAAGTRQLRARAPYDEPCLTNPTLANSLWAAVEVASNPLDGFVSHLRPWADFLHSRDDLGMLDGGLIDATPGNMIVSADGHIDLIDREYELDRPIETKTVVLRGLLPTLVSWPRTRAYDGVSTRRLWWLCQKAGKDLGFRLTRRDARRFCRTEAELLEAITGQQVDWEGSYRGLLRGRLMPTLHLLRLDDLRAIGVLGLGHLVSHGARQRLRRG